jgi:NADPH:quinone reductase-like Zn-dependent oxidoreductase
MVLGCEFAGFVEDVGEEVTRVAVSDRVTAFQQYSCGECERCTSWRQDLCERFTVLGTDAWGGYAERVCVPERAVIPLRRDDDVIVAAASQCVVSTAWHMTTSLAEVTPGEVVLVPSASGGVGVALVQCAKLAGARVIASVGNAEKASAVRALGADEVIVYSEEDLAERVRSLTGGEGVDAVLETVGGPTFETHLGTLRRDGRLVTCGSHTGRQVQIDIASIVHNGWQIRGFRLASPEEIVLSLRHALDGRIRIPVAGAFPMSDAAEAHRYLEQRRHVGKVVLTREADEIKPGTGTGGPN